MGLHEPRQRVEAGEREGERGGERQRGDDFRQRLILYVTNRRVGPYEQGAALDSLSQTSLSKIMQCCCIISCSRRIVGRKSYRLSCTECGRSLSRYRTVSGVCGGVCPRQDACEYGPYPLTSVYSGHRAFFRRHQVSEGISKQKDPRQVAQELVTAAREAGSGDDITVVVAKLG